MNSARRRTRDGAPDAQDAPPEAARPGESAAQGGPVLAAIIMGAISGFVMGGVLGFLLGVLI